LGETVEEIAFEKAGIFRQNIPVILGKNANISTLLARTKSLNNRVYLEGVDFDFDPVLNQWLFEQQIINLSNICLPINSVSIALAAYTILGNSYFTLPSLQEMSNCLSHIMMVGRAHCMKIREKTVMLDVAHNAPAAVWLAEKVEKIKQKGKILAVWASLADKDLTAITAPFKDLVESWYIGSLNAGL
jgi:dihydrofolate synthase/folylpolyglutamate synthase